MKLTSEQKEYLIKYQARLLNRSYLIEMFAQTTHPKFTLTFAELMQLLKQLRLTKETSLEVEDGAICQLEIINEDQTVMMTDYRIGIMEHTTVTTAETTTHAVNLVLLSVDKNPPFRYYDDFDLRPNEIANYTLYQTMNTTVGLFVLNYIVFVSSFGAAVPYYNDLWKVDNIEQMVSDVLLEKKITVDQFYKFVDNMYFCGHFTELSVPTFTERSFSTDKQVLIRKAELLKEYAGQLSDPIIVKKIEDELMVLDRAHIKGDASERFYVPLGAGKAFGIHRKKMFLTVGGIESFDEGTGAYDFITNSLREGWNKNDFVVICNEIRKGSYFRGKETEKGGTLTKFLMRVFQNLEITQEDCETTMGLSFILTPELAKQYLGRTIIVNKKPIMLTTDNIARYTDIPVILRSPMYCQTKDGLCYTCVGDRFRTLQIKRVGMLIVDISSTFTTLSMKNMHGTKIELVDIPFEKYFT